VLDLACGDGVYSDGWLNEEPASLLSTCLPPFSIWHEIRSLLKVRWMASTLSKLTWRDFRFPTSVLTWSGARRACTAFPTRSMLCGG